MCRCEWDGQSMQDVLLYSIVCNKEMHGHTRADEVALLLLYLFSVL